jgi:CPA2 family monovalent cation:H+ antiporter-2
MHHSTPLISTIVAGLVLAFIFGAIANRFKLPPLVGYLVAGVLVGPNTPGFVGDLELANELSEIGVILLMFGVGLHFSLKDLLSVRALAVPGAVVQIGGATLMGLGLGLLMGWSIGAGLIFGLALSVASTVVLLKALEDRRMLDSDKGRIAVGWLIVEDLAMVLALVLIPAIASISGVEGAEVHDPFVDFVERMLNTELGLVGILGITILKLAAFVGFMLVVGRRLIPMVLHYTAHTGSRELFRLAVLAIALGVAAGAAYLFGVSLALGAFFAGMILSESELSHRAANESLPLRDAFAVLFFVAVGMLFDPTILLRDPLPVLATVFIIVVGKSVLAFLIVRAFKRPVSTALVVSSSLAQIGEFSFILAALGISLGILPEEGRDLILAGAIVSIVLNPLIFMVLDAIRPWLESRGGRTADVAVGTGGRVEPDLTASVPREPAQAAAVEEVVAVPTAKSGHVVVVGYGRVGSVVGGALLEGRTPFLVIEDSEGRILAAKALGIEVIPGNAAAGGVLHLANVEGASTVVIAIPNAFEAGQATEQARKLNPKVLIVARGHSDEEEIHLKSLGADVVIIGEREIGLGMVDVINRDSSAVAEITAADAVASALAPLAVAAATAGPKLPADPNLLAEAIEAAQEHGQHADSGPAEPPAVVSSYGEEPDEPADAAPDAIEVPEDDAEDVSALLALDGATPDEVAAGDEAETALADELAPQSPEPVAAPEPAIVVPQVAPEPRITVLRPSSMAGVPFGGASSPPAPPPAKPFNPEVPPTDEEDKA